MTIGSYTDDRRYNVSCYTLQQPQGWYVGGPPVDRLTGFLYNKTWSGTDYPPAKVGYEKSQLITREGRVITFKRRKDKVSRLKFDDHPYSATITMKRDNPVSWDQYFYGSLDNQNVKRSQDLWGDGYIGLDAGDEWNSGDDLALIGRLRERVAGSDFNMGVFLGESREALHMITDSATRIYKAYRKVRKLDIAGAAAALATKKPKAVHKTVAGNWLELQYGWLPLIKDAQGAAEFLAKSLNYPMVQTYKVTRRKPIRLGPIAGTKFTRFDARGDTRVQIIARLSEVNVPELVGLTDPASVIWELTPFSFVADWFIPIGNYLAARSLASALTGVFVTTKTRRVSCIYNGLPNTDNGIAKTIWTLQPGGNYYGVTVNRTVTTTLQVPKPGFKTLDKVASWKHCANAVALLVSGFGGSAKR